MPIVVALNKIDLPGIDLERIYQQLAANDLLPTEWGGDTEVVKTSATTGTGIDELLETLLTIAELHELKANPNRAAMGTCLEAELHEGRGVVAKLLVQNGTLNVGDAVVCGVVRPRQGHVRHAQAHAKTERSRSFDAGKRHRPGSRPGRRRAFLRAGRYRRGPRNRRRCERQRPLGDARRAGPVHVTLENLFDRLGQEEVQTLNIILRADVRGSIEAIQKEFTKLEHPEVKIKILQATVGGITEADVHLADASDAVIIGFNVVPDEKARVLAEPSACRFAATTSSTS